MRASGELLGLAAAVQGPPTAFCMELIIAYLGLAAVQGPPTVVCKELIFSHMGLAAVQDPPTAVSKELKISQVSRRRATKGSYACTLWLRTRRTPKR